MSKGKVRRPRFVQVRVEDLLDASDVRFLAEELGEWRDNMDGANMSHLPKFYEVEEAANMLESAAESIGSAVHDLLELCRKDKSSNINLLEQTVRVRAPKSRQSRSDRAARVAEDIGLALETIRAGLEVPAQPKVRKEAREHAKAIISACDGLENELDELNGIEFPGMFS